MSERPDSVSAFPKPIYYDDIPDAIEHGMTLRDWFAGQALAGVIAAYSAFDGVLPNRAQAAGVAYEYADAMIAERAK